MQSFLRYEAYGHPDTRRDPAGPERFDRAIVNHLTTTETDALVAAPDRSAPTGRRDHTLLPYPAANTAKP